MAARSSGQALTAQLSAIPGPFLSHTGSVALSDSPDCYVTCNDDEIDIDPTSESAKIQCFGSFKAVRPLVLPAAQCLVESLSTRLLSEKFDMALAHKSNSF